MALADQDALAIEIVRESAVFKDFAQAFRRLTGMPLNLLAARAQESRACFCASGRENSFCALVTQNPAGAEACLRIQNSGRLRAHHHHMPAATRCFSGLIDLYVPIFVHGKSVATLVSGQVFQRRPQNKDLKEFDEWMKKSAIRAQAGQIRKALASSAVSDFSGIDAVVETLKIFADQLTQKWEQVTSTRQSRLSNAVQKGLDVVREHSADPKLDMKTASRMIGLNHFYFCKIFKREMGVGFLEYLNRERVSQAQKLLGNPDVRVKEIGYRSGFQSVATFNRVFKKHTGFTPTQYRDHLFAVPSDMQGL
jgi:AraC-like DNA-binding protein